VNGTGVNALCANYLGWLACKSVSFAALLSVHALHLCQALNHPSREQISLLTTLDFRFEASLTLLHFFNHYNQSPLHQSPKWAVSHAVSMN
jgi:hypothetical protein